MSEETIYYSDQNVLITKSRFVNGGKTYAMRNISSVQMGVIQANNSGYLLIIIVGILIILFAPWL